MTVTYNHCSPCTSAGLLSIYLIFVLVETSYEAIPKMGTVPANTYKVPIQYLFTEIPPSRMP